MTLTLSLMVLQTICIHIRNKLLSEALDSLRFHPTPHFLTDCHHCYIHHSGNIYQILSMTQIDITEDLHIRFYVFNIKRNAFHHVSSLFRMYW